MNEIILTPEQIARDWQLKPNTVAGWCRSGHLKAWKVGRQWRIKRSDWEEFIAKEEGERKKSNGLALSY